jgi:hypothetical protein
MASDRTLTRSGLSDQQGGWREPTAASGRKLPSAGRERKPALFALAVLLVALGAGSAGLLVLRAGGSQVAAIQITEQVSQDSQLPVTAMTEVDIPSTSALVQDRDYVPWADESLYAKYFASTTIMPGTLLTVAMVTTTNAGAAGQNLVGLSLKAGQVPANLMAGTKVGAVATSLICGANPGQVLATTAEVTNISGDAAAGGVEMVTIAVPPNSTPMLTCAAANGDVAVAQLPAGASASVGNSASPASTASPTGTASPTDNATAGTSANG